MEPSGMTMCLWKSKQLILEYFVHLECLLPSFCLSNPTSRSNWTIAFVLKLLSSTPIPAKSEFVLPRWAQSLPSLTIWLTLVSLQLFLPVILPLLGYSLIAQLVKNPPAMQETLVWFLGQEDLLGKGRLPTTVFLGFPCGSAGKESACNAGGQGSIPGLGRSPGEGNSYPLQYSGLENSMDCIVHGVAKSQTWLSDFQAINSLRNKYKF